MKRVCKEHWPFAIFASVAAALIIGISVSQGEGWWIGLLIVLFPVWGAIGLVVMCTVCLIVYDVVVHLLRIVVR